MRKVLTLVLVTAGVASATAQTRIPIGVDVGVFFPTSDNVRTVFGDTWFRVGLTPLSFQIPDRWSFAFDIGVLSREEGPDKVLLIPVTFGVTRSFGPSLDTRPYVALRVGPYYGDVNSPTLLVDESKFGVNANAALGMTFSNRFYIEGRYDFYGKFEGIDFSGFTISAGVRLFEIRL